jgi:hypothetical protein
MNHKLIHSHYLPRSLISQDWKTTTTCTCHLALSTWHSNSKESLKYHLLISTTPYKLISLSHLSHCIVPDSLATLLLLQPVSDLFHSRLFLHFLIALINYSGNSFQATILHCICKSTKQRYSYSFFNCNSNKAPSKFKMLTKFNINKKMIEKYYLIFLLFLTQTWFFLLHSG